MENCPNIHITIIVSRDFSLFKNVVNKLWDMFQFCFCYSYKIHIFLVVWFVPKLFSATQTTYNIQGTQGVRVYCIHVVPEITLNLIRGVGIYVEYFIVQQYGDFRWIRKEMIRVFSSVICLNTNGKFFFHLTRNYLNYWTIIIHQKYDL